MLQYKRIKASERIDINKTNKSHREINITNRRHYFFNDMINIKSLDPNLLEIDKIPFKSTDIDIYHIEYITTKSLDHARIFFILFLIM